MPIFHDHKLTALAIYVTIIITATCPAQKADFDPNEGTGRGWMPDPIESNIALYNLLKSKVQKGQLTETHITVNHIDASSDKEVLLPALLGMRVSDGMTSCMAKDIEKINTVSKDIEAMAKKLGIAETQLARANKMRSYAKENKWSRVFLELGYLQKDVLNSMTKEGNGGRRTILITAQWIQGFHFKSNLIMKNYSEDAAKFLREPALAKHMIKGLEALKPETLTDATTSKMLAVCKKLYSITDVPHNTPIPEDRVKEIYKITSQFAQNVQKPSSK